MLKSLMTMKVKVNVSVGERIAMLGILNGFKGSLDKLTYILDDVKLIQLTDEEKKVVNFRVQSGSENKSFFQWDDPSETKKELDLSLESIQYVKDSIKERSDKNEMTVDDRYLLTLSKALNQE